MKKSMKVKKISQQRVQIILGLLLVLVAGLTLSRCGSGVGSSYSATANSVKF